MGQVRDLIGAQGTAAASVLGPAEHPGLEEGSIDDQLPASLEQVEQANLTLWPVELVVLLHRRPRHASSLGRQRITGTGKGFLLHEELLVCGLPLLLRHDRRGIHLEMPFPVFLVSLFHFHFSLLSRFGTISSDPFFWREIFTANAATPPVEIAVPATTNPMVAKQNGHILHPLGGQLDR